MSTQPLTSRVVERATPAAQPFTFPGIFRSKTTDSLWIAHAPGYAIRLSNPLRRDPAARDHRLDSVGNCIEDTVAFGGRINETEYVQVTGPVTIEFNPSQSHFI